MIPDIGSSLESPVELAGNGFLECSHSFTEIVNFAGFRGHTTRSQ